MSPAIDLFLTLLFWIALLYGLRLSRRGALNARLTVLFLSVLYLLLRLRRLVDADFPAVIWMLIAAASLAWYLSGRRAAGRNVG